MWFTALEVFVKTNASLPAESLNTPAPLNGCTVEAFNVGVVSDLLVSVCVCALNVTSSSPVSKGNVIVLSVRSTLILQQHTGDSHLYH